MRCISYIGTDQLTESTYCHHEMCTVTDLVHEAVWQLWHPEELILVIGDPKLAYIASTCESRGIQVRKLWTGDGTGEDEFWEMFTAISEIVREGEEILFDITGGCHAFPFIISLVASYLKEIRHLRIRGIVYAATPDDLGMRHFVDLTPLLGVNEWISGVKTLTTFTDATRINRLLTGLQDELHRSRTKLNPPTHLTGWSHLLDTFTSAVRLNRPIDALYAGWGIIRDLPVVSDEINRFAPVLTPVMEDIQLIREMAALPPGDDITPKYLMSQLCLIRYQINQGLNFQAVSLSREWLITCTIIRFGVADTWLDPEMRHTISRTLTGLALTMQKEKAETTEYTYQLLEIENWKKGVVIWRRISDLRNDLAHCGMNERGESMKSLLKRTKGLPEDLLEFASIIGVTQSTEDSSP